MQYSPNMANENQLKNLESDINNDLRMELEDYFKDKCYGYY